MYKIDSVDNSHRKSSENNTSNIREDYLRPISASIKRPDMFKFGLKKEKKNEFPNLYNSNETSRKSSSCKIDKEQLYDENINLKNTINILKKEIAAYKSEVHKLELEQNKKDKAIEDMNYEILNTGGKVPNKLKETVLIISLKKQIKELQKENKNKNALVEDLKKNLKNTKLNEITQETQILTDEMLKIKSFYELSLRSNKEMEKYVRDYNMLQEVFAKQGNQLMILSENLRKIESELMAKNEELEKIKSDMKLKDDRVTKLKKDLKFQLLVNEKKEKISIELPQLKSKVSNYEKKIGELQNDLNFFKSEESKKDRKVKELEGILKNTQKITVNHANTSNFKETIKLIQKNPEENADSMNLFLKSKFQEISKKNEELEIENKKLKEKIEKYERVEENVQNEIEQPNFEIKEETLQNQAKNSRIDSHDLKMTRDKQNEIKNKENNEDEEDDYANLVFNEDQLKEFTYILLKNFEAQNIDNKRIEKIFKESDENSDEIVLNDIAVKIAEALNISNENDISKILIYLNTLIVFCESDYEQFKEKFLSLFDSINKFTTSQEEEYSKSLKTKLSKHKEYFESSLKFYDQENKGHITFLEFRKILDNAKIGINDDLIEYLIFDMKRFKHDNKNTLEHLKYDRLLRLLINENNKNEENDDDDDEKIQHKSDLNIKMDLKESKNSNDESGYVINAKEFDEKIEQYMKKISEFFHKNSKTVKSYFGRFIEEVKHENNIIKAISLEKFIEEIDSMGIEIDNLAVYILFAKFKFNDEIEKIDTDLLTSELQKYGINEISQHDKEVILTSEVNTEEFFLAIGNFLREKKQKLADFLRNVILTAEVDNETLEIVKVSELTELLINNNLLITPTIPKKILKLICEDSLQFVIIGKMKGKLETIFKKNLKKKMSEKKDDSKKINLEDLDQVNISNDIPNADSKVFNDSPMDDNHRKEEEKVNKDRNINKKENHHQHADSY